MVLTGMLITGGALYASAAGYRAFRPKRKTLGEILAASSARAPQTQPQPEPQPRPLLFDDMRREQFAALAAATGIDQPDGAAALFSHHLIVASVGLGLAVAGFLAPPLLLLSAPAVLYTTIPIIRSAWVTLREERRFCSAVLDSISILSALAAGAVFTGALSAWFYFLGIDLLRKTQHPATFAPTVRARGVDVSDRTVIPTLGIGALALAATGPIGAVSALTGNFSEVLEVIAPLSMLTFLNKAAAQDILIKDGRALELLRSVDTVLFDPSGSAPPPDAWPIIAELLQRNLEVYLVQGDQTPPPGALVTAAGGAHPVTWVEPGEQVRLLEALRQAGKQVCFIGDSDDAANIMPQAWVAITWYGASQPATVAAQIVLMDGSLARVPDLFDLARAADSNLQAALAVTLVPSLLCMGGVFFLHFGIAMANAFYLFCVATGMVTALWPEVRYWQQLQQEQTSSEKQCAGQGEELGILV